MTKLPLPLPGAEAGVVGWLDAAFDRLWREHGDVTAWYHDGEELRHWHCRTGRADVYPRLLLYLVDDVEAGASWERRSYGEVELRQRDRSCYDLVTADGYTGTVAAPRGWEPWYR